MIAACSVGKSDPAPKQGSGSARHAPSDAPPGVTTITGFDPNSGMHVDDDGHHTEIPQPAVVQPTHAGRPIDLTLRSSPPGSQVAVDGRIVGTTPTFSSVVADGSEHEFTFTLPHHTVARYRFVPITSGVIHARLEPVADEPAADPDDDAPEGAPVPGAGSELVNPMPSPMAKPDALPTPPTGGMGPQP